MFLHLILSVFPFQNLKLISLITFIGKLKNFFKDPMIKQIIIIYFL